MARYKVVPTKTNLARLKRDMNFAQEGYDLLEQKRQILIVELMGLIDRTADAQEKSEKSLAEAFHALQQAVLSMGRTSVTDLAKGIHIDSDITINFRRIMGVNIPKVEVEVRDYAPYFSLSNTSFWIDETIVHFKTLLNEIGRLAEMRISLMRLAQEVQKTMRRVNALDKIAIPDFKESVKYIEDTLEESEREMFAMQKVIKERLQKTTR
ncbi:V-type ATP synthase subunit D [candidate division KSB1 bacterium]|nr:V-type ATP synthase subunit D [candidate division KSB1 bacterium]